MSDRIPCILKQLRADAIRDSLFHLSSDPLPFRKVNLTLPGHAKSTLDETDDYLLGELTAFGYEPTKEPVQVQAFGFDAGKPRRSAFARPGPDDPWYTAHNLYAEKRGSDAPDEIIVVLAHKDSQSWFDSPGAYDNAVGTSAVLEIARVLAGVQTRRTVRFLFCNEEHTPWTSVTAAENAKQRGDSLAAVFNVDSVGGKSQEEVEAGRKPNVTLYTTPEGKRLADLVTAANVEYGIGLEQRTHQREHPGDDDGSFVKAGFPAAIMNLGSFPYANPDYYDAGDIPEKVDVPNAFMATQATLAAVLRVDRDGAP